jgi:hypothetical protein
MSSALWIPIQEESQRDTSYEWERPYLQLPVPMPPMRVEQAPGQEDEDDGPRVIIIDL